jgi:hypothetical protein
VEDNHWVGVDRASHQNAEVAEGGAFRSEGAGAAPHLEHEEGTGQGLWAEGGTKCRMAP